MQTYYTICVTLILGIPLISGLENERDQKLISTFQIVSFPNDVCDGSGTRNGTCYTSQECASRSGTSSGSCADGFGVCCVFVVNQCGSTTSENITAWTTPTTLPATANSCSLTVCPSTDICSLRLDFTTFTITGPSTRSTMSVRRRLGTPTGNIMDVTYLAEGSSYATNCLVDLFSTTSPSPSSTPPSVCGSLTGEHMYVEADADRCNVLKFNFAANAATLPAATTTNDRGQLTVATRNWDITVSQIECTSATLPPTGCTKFYWARAGLHRLTTYNFGTAATSTHLASQHERFCIRRERGNCIGCFSAASIANVGVSGDPGIARVHTQAGLCCGYFNQPYGTGGYLNTATTNMDGLITSANTQPGFDCLIIPGAFGAVGTGSTGTPVTLTSAAIAASTLRTTQWTSNVIGNVPFPPHVCGNGAGLGIGAATRAVAAGDQGAAVQAGGTANLTICTRHVPFKVEFMSDDLDGAGSIAGDGENTVVGANNRGFQLEATQISCNAATG